MDLCYKANLQEYVPGIQVIYSNGSFLRDEITFISREEYLICEFSCVLSNVGGYVGLFFGVSFLDFVFLGEWLVEKLTGVIQKHNKNI